MRGFPFMIFELRFLSFYRVMEMVFNPDGNLFILGFSGATGGYPLRFGSQI